MQTVVGSVASVKRSPARKQQIVVRGSAAGRVSTRLLQSPTVTEPHTGPSCLMTDLADHRDLIVAPFHGVRVCL